MKKDIRCKGCKATCSESAEFKDQNNKTIICPCVNCIVKSMCISICKEFCKFQYGRDYIVESLWPPSRFISDDTERCLLVFMEEK